MPQGYTAGGWPGLLLLDSPRVKRGGAVPLQTVILATSEPLSALGRAGKPQFITKMENDTSPRSAPREADL